MANQLNLRVHYSNILLMKSVLIWNIYYNSKKIKTVYDPELNMELNWGIDLLSGYKYFVIPEKKKFFWLKNKLRNENYDLLIINGYNQLVLVYSIILSKIYCKKISLRLDTVEFSNKESVKKIFKKKVFWLFNKLFDHFFAIGSLTVKFLKKMGVSEKKISIFSYVVDKHFFEKNSRLTNGEKLLLKNSLNISPNAKIIISVAKFSEREAPWDPAKSFYIN